MPRIDPLQLLKCLSVLLSSEGGIKSKDEVQRLASLMTKFSKKLVSKCIYVQILKTTNSELLDMFMGAGGWDLLHMWLSDAIVAKNWPLILELLDLLLVCPVDTRRLKTNTCPKLIKGLSKNSCNQNARELAVQLVDQWLKIVKAESSSSGQEATSYVARASSEVEQKPELDTNRISENVELADNSSEVSKSEPQETTLSETVVLISEDNRPLKVESVSVKEKNVCDSVKEEKEDLEDQVMECASTPPSDFADDTSSQQLPVYKITIRDGKQVLAKVQGNEKSSKRSGNRDESSKNSKLLDSDDDDDDDNDKKVEIAELTKSSSVMKVEKATSAKHRAKIEKTDSVSSSDSSKDSPRSRKKAKSRHEHRSSEKSNKSSKSDKGSKSESVHDKSKINTKDKSKISLKDKLKRKEKLSEKDNKNSDKKLGNNSPDYIQDEKDRATLAKLIPPTISKLGKIPKKQKTEDTQKPGDLKTESEDMKKSVERKSVLPPPPSEPKKAVSISIEVRKPDAARPNTVKTFKSKFRSTGLEEEVKPPPSRKDLKKSVPPLTLPFTDKKPPIVKPLTLKRPSPIKEVPLPEKKMKVLDLNVEDNKKEKTGGVKLIPPRPKPFLQESDMFMDALTACSKEQPRKRKRRPSTTKDGPEQKKDTTVKEEGSTTPPASPDTEINTKSPPIIKPFKFYQDTLDSLDENKDATEVDKIDSACEVTSGEENNAVDDLSKDPSVKSETEEMNENETSNESMVQEDVSTETDAAEQPAVRKGVLIYHKVRGPKKSVRFRSEGELEEVKYFELDETERVNVTKNFIDMKEMERRCEREAFFLARKLAIDDVMEERIAWYPPYPIDLPDGLVEYGKNSQEKDIQYARERVVLQALYFSRNLIPDSPGEPDMEIHATTDPTIIPLDDTSGNPDAVNDFTNTPWPDPKPLLIPQSPPHQFQTPKGPQQIQQLSPTHQHQAPPQLQPHQMQMQPQPNQSPQYPFPMGQFPTGPHMYAQAPQPLLPLPNIPPNMMNMANMANMTNITSPPPLLMTPNIPPLMNPGGGGGDWRTGDGKVIAMGEMPMEMYNQAPPNMGMHPEMPFMMPTNDGSFQSQQGFLMGGAPNMFPQPQWNANMMNEGGSNDGGNERSERGGSSNRRSHGRGNRGHRGGSGSGGSWHQGSNWPSNRGNRGNRNAPSRTVCRHFQRGYCRHEDKCQYLHPKNNQF